MRILVRVPNWLGDLVMSYAFFEVLKKQFPSAQIEVVVKKNLASLVALFPQVDRSYIFDKKEYNSLAKIRQFAKGINQEYDYFFCLPNSFSSAWMGYFILAINTIGYKKECRSFLLSQSFCIPKNIHRTENYIRLLENTFHFQAKNYHTFFPEKATVLPERLKIKPEQQLIALNLVSEDKRRTFNQAASICIIETLQKAAPKAQIAILGTQAAKNHIQPILKKLQSTKHILNLTNQTSLLELSAVLANANLLVSTDSGPAHLANSLKTPVIVFFGTGKANETAPYEKKDLAILDFNNIDIEVLSSAVKFFIL